MGEEDDRKICTCLSQTQDKGQKSTSTLHIRTGKVASLKYQLTPNHCVLFINSALLADTLDTFP